MMTICESPSLYTETLAKPEWVQDTDDEDVLLNRKRAVYELLTRPEAERCVAHMWHPAQPVMSRTGPAMVKLGREKVCALGAIAQATGVPVTEVRFYSYKTPQEWVAVREARITEQVIKDLSRVLGVSTELLNSVYLDNDGDNVGDLTLEGKATWKQIGSALGKVLRV